MAYRAGIGAEHVLVLADIQVKYAQMLAPRTLAESARRAARGGRGRDRGHGHAHGRAALARTRCGPLGRAPATAPCSSAAGSTPATPRALLAVADGAIVGTSLMRDGRATPEQVSAADRGARVRFVCAADCGVDRYDDRGIERAGGIGLNVAVHLRRLCAPGDTVTAVAADRRRRRRGRRARRHGAGRAWSRASRSCPVRRPCSTSATRPAASASSSATTRACWPASA